MGHLLTCFALPDGPAGFLYLEVNYEFIKIAGPVAGIGGVAIGAMVIIFREVIRKRIFPQLTRRDAYRLLRLIAVLSVLVAGLGIVAWLYSKQMEMRANAGAGVKEYRLSGVVRDEEGRGLPDVAVSVVGGEEKYQTTSSGSFFLTLRRERVDSVRLHALKSGYVPWDEVVSLPRDDVVIRLQRMSPAADARERTQTTPAEGARGGARKPPAARPKGGQSPSIIDQRMVRPSGGNRDE